MEVTSKNDYYDKSGEKTILYYVVFLMGIFVTMENLIHDLVNHNLQNRAVVLLENGSWAPASGKLMREALGTLKGVRFLNDTVTIKSALKEEQLVQLDAVADAIAAELVPAAEQ